MSTGTLPRPRLSAQASVTGGVVRIAPPDDPADKTVNRAVFAKGTMFITLDDETRIAHLFVCPRVFEADRRVIPSAGMVRQRRICERLAAGAFQVVHQLKPSPTVAPTSSRP